MRVEVLGLDFVAHLHGFCAVDKLPDLGDLGAVFGEAQQHYAFVLPLAHAGLVQLTVHFCVDHYGIVVFVLVDVLRDHCEGGEDGGNALGMASEFFL